MSLVSERFKAIQAEAKKIREKNSKLTQAEAVKKAWAIYNKKSKAGTVGNVTIKKAGKNDERYIVMNDGKEHLQGKKLFKKDAETVAKALRIVKKKRSAAAKKTVGKPAAKSMHKDTKSHNVNIRVMSGYNGMQHLKNLLEEKSKLEQKLIAVQNYKNDKNPEVKKHYKFWNARLKKIIASLKKQITEAKKSIQ